MALRAICKFTDWLVRPRRVYGPKRGLLLKFNLYIYKTKPAILVATEYLQHNDKLH